MEQKNTLRVLKPRRQGKGMRMPVTFSFAQAPGKPEHQR